MSLRAVDRSASESSPSETRGARSRIGRAPLVLATLLATAAGLSPGCAYGPQDDSDTVVEALNANTRTAYDYFIGKGLTPVQSAGIVGNLIQESNVDPTAVQPGGPGRGIAQWSVGGRWDHDAGDNVVAYAASHGGADRWSLSLQLDFIWFELTNFSGYGLSQLRASTTISSATIAFETRFEGCGACLESQRISYATQVLNAYGSTAWGAQFVSQSFPYASVGSVTIEQGHSASVSLTMKNIGTHAWDSHTCIATTSPRDRNSQFAGSEWTMANRPSCVPAGTTVAAGANHTFTWTMHAPATLAPGRYDEHWGMVEDGTTWFSATGEGGPPDDQLEGIFTVTAAPAMPDAGAPDAGHDGGTTGDAATGGDAAMGSDASESDAASDGGAGDGGHADAAGDHAGDGGMGEMPPGCACRATGAHGTAREGAGALLGVAVALAGARRRRRARSA